MIHDPSNHKTVVVYFKTFEKSKEGLHIGIINRAIGIINFEKPFLNFIVDTMN